MDNLIKQLPWDVKSTISKVKNAVLNYTEMEAKVREATNNDAWGASSTLLQEIARATNQYQYFNEIMPMVYKRFAEAQKNWRQIYKTLQLVEYLIKNGSERVIDNVRDHIFEIKTLMNFHFVDEKGKDQVRHRAKEIVELIDDNDRLRSEREKAQANRNKYGGVSSDAARYGGFGSESFSRKTEETSFSSSNYPGNSSTTGSTFSTSAPSARRPSDRAAPTTSTNSSNAPPAIIMSGAQSSAVAPTTVSAPAPAAPQSNLLDLDFAPATAPAPAAGGWGAFSASPVQQQPQQQGFASFQAAPAADNAGGFGDFASFQAAPATNNSGFASVQAAPAGNGFASFQAAPVANNSGFGGFAAATSPNSLNNAASGFGNFNNPTPAAVPTINTSASQNNNLSAGFGNFAAAPATSPSTASAPKKAEDVWNSNLVALDSLTKFSSPQPKPNGPALNQMGSQPHTPVPAANNVSGGFGAFTVASGNNNGTGFGGVNANMNAGGFGAFNAAPAQTGGASSGFGAFQAGPAAQQWGAPAATSGGQKNNDLLF